MLARGALGAAFLAALALFHAQAARGQAAINCSTEFYAVSQNGQLFRVNIATGAGTLMGTAAPFQLTEVEYDAASGELWASDGSVGTTLHKLGPATGAEIGAVTLNPSGPLTGLEFVGNTLYATRIAAASPLAPSSLVTVDRTTGVVTTIGPTGLNNPISGLAYDKTNAIMYGVVAGGGTSSLVKINLATGAATNVGGIGFSKVGSIEFGNDGLLYGGVADPITSTGALIRINTTTGAGTLIGLAGGGLRITGLTACPTGSSRTFVSVDGTDAGSCPATSPCRSLTYAITQTVARGEIQILDSGGYGGVTIDKSMTIAAADGVYAGITVSSGVGITVDAGPSGRVALRGLTINGLGGTRAVDLVSAAALYVDQCTISGFSDAGVRAQPVAASTVYVRSSHFHANSAGISAGTTTSGMLALSIARSRFEGNTKGIDVVQRGAIGNITKSTFVGGTSAIATTVSAPASASLDIRHSVFQGANEAIHVAGSAGGIVRVAVDRSLISENGVGVFADVDGTAYVSDSTILRNGVGLQKAGNGVAVSFGDNRLLENTTNGTFTSTLGKS